MTYYTKKACHNHDRHDLYCDRCIRANDEVNKHLCRHGYTYGPTPCQVFLCQEERANKNRDVQAMEDRMLYVESKADLLRTMDAEGFHELFQTHTAKEASKTNPCMFHYNPEPGCGRCGPTGNEISLAEAFQRRDFAMRVLIYNGHDNALRYVPSQEEVARLGRRPGRLVDDALYEARRDQPKIMVSPSWINNQYTRHQNGLDYRHNMNPNHDAQTTTPRPQEASMSRPSVITTVSLDRAEHVTLADLKSLIAEVERVGGDDTAEVSFSQQAYRWDVRLSVKANEVEPEPAPLTPEQESDLLNEYRASGTTKTRKTEIKNLLGL